MKHIKTFTVSLFAICGLLLPSLLESVNAAGGYEASFVSNINKSSASIQGDSIQLTVRSQAYDCDGSRNEFRTDPSRCSAPVGAPQLVGVGGVGVAVEFPGGSVSPSGTVTTDGSGYAKFTLTSSTPGQKAATIKGYPGPGPLVAVGSQTVTFVDAQPKASSTPAPSNTSTGRSAVGRSQNQQTTAQNENAPTAPAVQEVKIGGLQLKPDASENELPTIQQNKSLKLSGKTTPNTDVIVYVFSEPKMFKTKSDANGNWSVDVKDLPAGTHHAEFEAIDPASGQPLPRVQLGYFKVQSASSTAKNVTSTSASTVPKSNTSKIVLAGGVLLVVISGAGYIFYIKKIKNKRTAKPGIYDNQD